LPEPPPGATPEPAPQLEGGGAGMFDGPGEAAEQTTAVLSPAEALALFGR